MLQFHSPLIYVLLTARSLTRSAFTMNPFSNIRVALGIAVTVALHLLIIYALPHIGINPFRVAPFPAQWWLLIVPLGLPGLLAIEWEGFLTARLRKRAKAMEKQLSP